MECFICGKNTTTECLCMDHANKLALMLEMGKGIIQHPDWKYHCAICGEYKGRVIVEYPLGGYFCDRDILEEVDKYKRARR